MNGSCVYLVGAGCGAADLITLRGLERLRGADAVVYDDLIDPALLAEAPAEAELIYVGKRLGRHSTPQEEIDALLIRLAGEGKTVVRLKGGDPFVFGRGGEEALALQRAQIPFEEVPGISSAIAIPAAAGIPVTHRGLSQGVHILTGHTAQGGLPGEIDRAAALEGTLVFLMGLSKLPQIAERLVAKGKDPATPAAVVSSGDPPCPAVVRGVLADIAQRARAAGVVSPAVIVVGKTAGLDLSCPVAGPLEGARVGLVGTPAMTGKLARALRDQGARGELVCALRTAPVRAEFDFSTLAGEGRRWLVFTSGNGVEAFFRLLRQAEVDLRALASCRFAAIGAATARALAEHGIRADLCPEEYTSAGLARSLLERAAPEEELILFRSAQATRTLPEALLAAGRRVREVPVYDIEIDRRLAPSGGLPPLDYLLFSSAGGVDAFFQLYGPPPEQVRCVCIGAVTARALRERTDRPFLTAPSISAQGLLAAMAADRAGAAERGSRP